MSFFLCGLMFALGSKLVLSLFYFILCAIKSGRVQSTPLALLKHVDTNVLLSYIVHGII